VTSASRQAARVLEQLPNALYRVELDAGARPRLVAHLDAGADLVRVRPGDAVFVEILPLDAGRARIVGRRD
jgi:translation initiation factor IF-1